jgi:hypothetical protein
VGDRPSIQAVLAGEYIVSPNMGIRMRAITAASMVPVVSPGDIQILLAGLGP